MANRMQGMRMIAGASVVLLAAALSACSGGSDGQTQDVVRVPADASLTDAGALVADGGVILIAPGTYNETIEVRGSDVTIRGEDRNEVILDGDLALSSGVIATGERVTVENLTVRNYLQNGVLITGLTDDTGAGIARGPDGYVPEDAPDLVPGYLVQNVTSSNNGLYGIYAFNRTEGVIRNNVATGGSDSGIYVGQCDTCNALVEGNIVERNAVGIELANASNSVVITGNQITNNRIGVSVLSNYLEAHGPSRGVRIIGNVISDNNERETPVQAGGAFGIGVGLSGTIDADVSRNRITGNDNVGVWISSSEDFAPYDNVLSGGVFGGNGIDVAYTPAIGDGANCFDLDTNVVTEPAGLADADCGAPTPVGSFTQPDAPQGVAFSQVELPGPQPDAGAAGTEPTQLPDHISFPDLDSVDVPADNFLTEGAR